MPIQGYSLGCPIWANKDWIGSLFANGTRSSDFLQQYAQVFNTVEGNTTFYALPSPDTVHKWLAQTPDDFRFCLKLHRSITHEKRLHHATEETNHFFRLFAPLQERLGPFLIQLPPAFEVRDLPVLEAFLDRLPSEFGYALEVRHLDFFRYDHAEEHLNHILASRQIDQVILDARGIHNALDPNDHTQSVQTRKPNLPVHFETTGPRPFVRYISDPTITHNDRYWEHWAQLVAAWRNEGQHPYFFMHVPDNRDAPAFARHFHQRIQHIDPGVGTMPPWPGEAPPAHEQFALFGDP